MTPSTTFGEAFKSYWKNYFNFKGRARRSECWWMVLGNFFMLLPFLVIYLIVTVLIIFSIIAIITTLNFLPLLLVAFIYHPIKYVCLGYVVITFIPNLSLLIRRFHDIGRTSICPLVLYVTYFIISYVVIFDPLNCFEKANFEILKHALILMTIAIVIFLIAFISLDSKKGCNKYGESSKYPSSHYEDEDKVRLI
ncbi:DUF805 domain-containing protein [Staphylococcus pettenkoferi]|uniref:DUF805 domain-containing protein n=1 Tax=Staphylococcus pettenkoferi TaxID=170573 RepID=UPI0002433190|nr:DUF805 domain-containing protein [Staphylococcus pettenkoferi]EHM70701.1 hypothetical protein SEVCU012_1928 [Staphylococcus pettenkoferi VCU012]MCY1581551.1 DUF805 domain-containing protein [Staphylococcus pettenkoferi]MCY1621348.1 DUF805 domain-containing protein [Staphylococcus pettenkoferi]